MVDIIIVIGTAFVANIIWGRFIDPKLDSRLRKAVFVEPKKFAKSECKGKI